MQSLSANQILQIWELGQHQHPIDRAITLLAVALPDRSQEELSSLTIGQRDALLLLLREQTLGTLLESFAACPCCGELLEFSLSVTDLRLTQPCLIPSPPCELDIDGYRLTVALPNSRDLAAVVHCSSLATAQAKLMQRCIRNVTRWEESGETGAIVPDTLPASVWQQLADQIAAADPQAQLFLDLTCPACRHDWQVLFDIVAFFWTELSVQAKRLLGEVHRLARSYGWHEADILAMSSARRQFYLDLVDA